LRSAGEDFDEVSFTRLVGISGEKDGQGEESRAARARWC